MYIEVCLPRSVEIKKWSAFSHIIPAHTPLFSSLHSPHKAHPYGQGHTITKLPLTFCCVLCLCYFSVLVYAYTCLHVSPMEKNSYIHLLSCFTGPLPADIAQLLI